MSRRASLPGAAELFRSTSSDLTEPATSGGDSLVAEGSPSPVTELRTLAPDVGTNAVAMTASPLIGANAEVRELRPGATSGVRRTSRPARNNGLRAPSGRERHEEKITVYCSPDELVDLETTRLHLRAEHGLAVDRGRIVREAIAVVLADFESKGDASILVRRLREITR